MPVPSLVIAPAPSVPEASRVPAGLVTTTVASLATSLAPIGAVQAAPGEAVPGGSVTMARPEITKADGLTELLSPASTKPQPATVVVRDGCEKRQDDRVRPRVWHVPRLLPVIRGSSGRLRACQHSVISSRSTPPSRR